MCPAQLLWAALLALAGCGACGDPGAPGAGAHAGQGALEGQGAQGGEGGGPQFAARQQRHVRGLLGGEATLHCHVLRLGDKAVSWVRMRDLQILAHAGAVFTADRRVRVPGAGARGRGEAAHALRITALRAADAGRYECQVNTEPKMSLLFDLEVRAEADRGGDDDEETDGAGEVVAVSALPADGVVRGVEGGEAELACSAEAAVGREAPAALLWSRPGRPGALRAEGARLVQLSERAGRRLVARLRLARLRQDDAGAYRCRSRRGPAGASLRLEVAAPPPADPPEAMQRDQAAGGAARARGAALALPAALALLARS